MQYQPTQAGVNKAPRPRRGGKRRPAHLAALPDPREQEQLGAAADQRARELLERADADGRPLLDSAGHRRSPITLPEYRQGRAPANKGRRFPIEILNPLEVRALLDAPPQRGKTALRDRALIVVLYRVGLRIAEALALELKDVDLELGAVTVLLGKGAKRRVVGIDPAARLYIAAWLNERARLGIGVDAPLFCTVSRDAAGPGRRMHDSCAREMLKARARRAGITKRVTPHTLRHTCAAEMGLEGVPVPLIQDQLGHADMAMTEHYVRHLLPSQLIERISGRSWAGEPGLEPPVGAALADGVPVPAAPSPSPRMDPPEPKPAPDRGRRAAPGKGAQRVLDAISANGGAATQGQLRRALDLSCPTLLRHLHRLHGQGAVIRAGFDRNRSIIWKLAPAPVVLHPITPLRCAPNGEGPRRVLDAVDGLGGRASQAELARALEISPNTVHDHCLALEVAGALERGGLDKSTSRRGSQVWRVPPTRPRYQDGGYMLRIKVPGTI